MPLPIPPLSADASAPVAPHPTQYVLVLYVAGATARSLKAIQNARALCDELLEGRCTLEIVDIYSDPALAREHQVVAVPTLIKMLPPPLRHIIGDLSERERVLVGLDLRS